MKRTTRFLGLAAVVAVAGTVGWHAFAQSPMGSPHGMGMGMGGGHGPMAGGVMDPAAHLAGLKTDLGITAGQEPAWDSYAKVLADAAAAMMSQHAGVDMSAMHSMSHQDRQTRMTQMRDQHAAAFPAIKAAAETLLAALDDAQKAKAKDILPGVAEHGPGMMRHAGMGVHGMTHGTGSH